MSRAPAESRALTAGKWLLAFVVVASALALGSVPVGALLCASVLGAAACALLWLDGDVAPSTSARWTLIALAILLGMTVLQAVPLPPAVTHALAPANAEIWERSLSPLREAGPAWHSLGIAPIATRVEILRGFFYGCVLLGALRIASLPEGAHFLVRLVVFSACVMALSSLGHAAVSAQTIFGVYRPREIHAYRIGHLSPLLNTNHLAAYLNVGACVALGALVKGRSMPRALSSSAVLVLGATSVWQGSRGATGALLFGAVLTVALTVYAKRSFRSARANPAILAVCAIAAAAMTGVALSDLARDHLVSSDLTKLDVAKSAGRLVSASPWLGVGRGGFESVFSSVRVGTTYWTFTHPEDILVQWFVEWGVPVSLACMGIFVWAMRPQVALRAVRPELGAWAAVVIAVSHDLVDYHLEVPGVVALVAVCVAMVLGARVSRERTQPSRKPAMRYVAFGLVFGTAVAAVAAIGAVGHSLADERRTMSALATDKTLSEAEFNDVIRASMLRYPAEPFIPLMGAVRAQVVGDGTVVPWVARALERNARFGRAHFVLARSLGRRRAAQARLEYRLAYEYDEQLRSQVVAEGAPLVEDADTALELVPDGPAGAALLETLVAAVADRLPSTAVLLDKELERRSQGALGPLRRRAAAAAADASGERAPWCSGTRCIDDGIAVVNTLVARDPEHCESHLLIARLRIADGDVAGALDYLERTSQRVSDRVPCEKAIITLAFQHGQTRRGDASLEKLARSGCGGVFECADLYGWAASMEESRGHYVRAVRLYRRVLEVAPEREDALQRIGELGSHSGVLADAIDAYATLERRHPEDPRWAARLAELRASAGSARRPPSLTPP